MKRLRVLLFIGILFTMLFSTSIISNAATGWKKSGDTWVYYDDSGNMVTGWKKIDNKWYYFDNQGLMAIGWKRCEDLSGTFYFYFSEDTASDKIGVMQTGWIEWNNKWYYCDSKGHMLTDWQTINNKYYYFYSNGAMATGWLELEKKHYYLSKKESNLGVMLTGWQTIDGKDYYFNSSSGVMSTGWKTLDTKTYYFNKNGVLQKGRMYIAEGDNNYEYYLDPSSGVRRSGWILLEDLNEYRYYNTSNGRAYEIAINETNFPDTTLRAYVKKLDSNNNNKLDLNELPLKISANDLSNVSNTTGLDYLLPEIYEFSLNNNKNITSLNLSKGLDIKTLDLNNCSKLTSITLNSVCSITINTCDSFTTIKNTATSATTSVIKYSSLDIINCKGLKSFSPTLYVSSLYIEDCPNLTTLDVSKITDLYDLTIHTAESLVNLNAKNSSLRNIDIYEAYKLSTLNVNNKQIIDLSLLHTNISYDFRDYTSLENLTVNGMHEYQLIYLPKYSKKLNLQILGFTYTTILDTRYTPNFQYEDVSKIKVIKYTKSGFYNVDDNHDIYIETTADDNIQIHKGTLQTDIGNFYCDEEGNITTGVTNIGDDIYLFNDKGILPSKYTGSEQNIIGKAVTGFIDSKTFDGCTAFKYFNDIVGRDYNTYRIEDSTILKAYCDEYGKMASGKQTIDNKTYDFVKIRFHNFLKDSSTSLSDVTYLYVSANNIFIHDINQNVTELGYSYDPNCLRYFEDYQLIQNGVHKLSYKYSIVTSTHTMYFIDSYAQCNGLIKDNDKLYYSTSYNLLSGKFTIGTKTYYADPETYEIYHDKMFDITINDSVKTFYSNSNGEIQTGFFKVNDKMYYCEHHSSGITKNTTFKYNDDDYYATEDGSLYTGLLVTKENYKYYYDENYKLLKNQFYTIDGHKVYICPSGVFARGSFEAKDEHGVTHFYQTDEDGYLSTGIMNHYKLVDNKNVLDTKYYCIDGIVQKNLSDNKYYHLTYDKKYYLITNENGKIVENAIVLDSKNNNRYLVRNFEVIHGNYTDSDGKKYYADKNGILQINTMITYDDGSKGYTNEYGQAISRTYTDQTTKKSYYANDQYILQKGFIKTSNSSGYLANDDYELLHDGIHTYNGNKYYLNGYNVIVNNLFTIGTSTNTYYYSNDEGILQTGFIKHGNYTYYFDPKTYESVKGLQFIDNKYYFFNSSSIMQTGFKTITINDQTNNYYFNPYLLTGFFEVDNGNNKYTGYVNPETYEMYKDQLVIIDGKEYIFDSSSYVAKQGFHTINSITYFIDPTTHEIVKNQFIFKPMIGLGDHIWYADENGSICKNSTREINGITLTFDEYGRITSDKVITDNKTYILKNSYIANGIYIENDHEVVYDDGTQITSGWYTNYNATYYVDPTTHYLVTGWKTINNKKYYFDYANKMTRGRITLDNKTYCFDQNGVMYTGWQKLGDNNTYYFDKNGVMAKGLQTINNNTYYFDTNGCMKTGKQTINGKEYNFGTDGKLITSTTDTTTKVTPGWKKTSGGWKYQFSNGKYAKSEYIGGYWINSKGYWTYKYRATWKHNKKGWWYGDSTGWYAKIQWLKKKKKWYYFNKAGYIVTSWQKIGTKWYYFDKTNGFMKTGWLKLSGKWYYLDPTNGYMLVNTSKKIGSKTYKFDKNGVCTNP